MNVNIDAELNEKRQGILNGLTEFQKICDGLLGSLGRTKHCIKLSTLLVRTINFAPCHIGPRAWKIRESRNRPNTRHERYRAHAVRAGIVNRISPEERRLVTIMDLLKKAGGCDREECLPVPRNRR